MPEEIIQEIPRRKFVKRFLTSASAMAALPAIGMPVFTASKNSRNTTTDTFNFLAQPYLQNLLPTTVALHFIASKIAHAWIEYSEGKGPLQKAQSSKDGMIDIHTHSSIRLLNLKPGTIYNYKIVAKEIVSFEPYKLVYGTTITSPEYQFKTPEVNAETMSCLFLNDIHDRPESFQKLVSLAGNREYESVILNGDMFNFMTNEQQVIDHLLTPCANSFSSTKPFYFLRGNHETRGVYSRDINQYFTFPEQAYYFAKQAGPVQFIFLDTGEDKPDDAPVYSNIVDFDNYRLAQAAWLEELVQTRAFKKAPFRVVVMHIPTYHSGDWHGTMHCRKLFSPIFEKNKIDLVICGHTHKYGIHPPSEEHKYPIIIGGGPKDTKRTVIHFTANKSAIDITMIRDDGTTVGTYTAKRK